MINTLFLFSYVNIFQVENFTEFDVIESQAVGDECSDALRTVTDYFETTWDAGGDEKQAMLDLFGTPDDFTKGFLKLVSPL